LVGRPIALHRSASRDTAASGASGMAFAIAGAANHKDLGIILVKATFSAKILECEGGSWMHGFFCERRWPRTAAAGTAALWSAALALIAALLLSAPVPAQQAAKLMPTDEPLSAPVANPGEPLPRARPEEVGMSSPRLAEIGQMLEAEIAAHRMPGAVVAIARRGKLVYFQAHGYRDKAAGVPMTVDTIFNIASMTKPLTAVAALMLYENGKLLIGEPLATYLPKFRDMQVAVLDPAGDMIVEKVPATRKITIQDLMRHTSGLIYGGRGSTAVHKMYPASSASAATTMAGAEFLAMLSSLPLRHQPGTVWDYGFGLDVLGLTVESLEQRTLGQVLQERLLNPLGTVDTGFFIPAAKAERYARALPNDPVTGQPQSLDLDLTRPLKFECGGGCAVSTAGDYLRFALMLLNKGKLGETRILGRKTVEYMLSNQLGPEVKNLISAADPTRADYGFGLSVAVRTTPGIVPMMGSLGEFGWAGASGTNWWADPQEDLAVVFMAHTPGPIRWHYRQVINALVERAIMD
jgi:CubicO group peptidase (beta-lactamase class C family)